MSTADAYTIAGTHPADRVMAAQSLRSDVYLHGDPPPTRNQVAAVLHALADHTHNVHMLSDAVAALGADRDHLGPGWAHASGLGRYFHALGDHLETCPDPQPEAPAEPGDGPCSIPWPHTAHRWDSQDRAQLRYTCPGRTGTS